jgi:hypothetical protein
MHPAPDDANSSVPWREAKRKQKRGPEKDRVLHFLIMRRQLLTAANHRLLDDLGDDAGAAKTKRAEARFALSKHVVGKLTPSPTRSSITR